jgi:hypothetical protein
MNNVRPSRPSSWSARSSWFWRRSAARFLNMTDGATMPAFGDERLIDAAGAVVADRPEQRPLLVVAGAGRL